MRAVLRLVGAGGLIELRSIADLDGASFDHDIEAVEPVLTRSENALRSCFRFFALRSAGPVQKYIASSCHTANSGVTWGRPSGRTVESQNTSAPSMFRRPSAQSVGFAPGLLRFAAGGPLDSASTTSPVARKAMRGVACSTARHLSLRERRAGSSSFRPPPAPATRRPVGGR